MGEAGAHYRARLVMMVPGDTLILSVRYTLVVKTSRRLDVHNNYCSFKELNNILVWLSMLSVA